MAKPEIREIARSLGLKVADKVDSQEICFVPGNDYKAFLAVASRRRRISSRRHLRSEPATSSPSTKGSRCSPSASAKACPAARPQPRYVVDIDPETNRVIVGDAEDLLVEEFEIDRVNWSSRAPSNEPLEVTVKIRYSHPGRGAPRSLRWPGDRALRSAGRAAESGHARPGRGLLRRRRRRRAAAGFAGTPQSRSPNEIHGGRSAARPQHLSRCGHRAAHQPPAGRRKMCRLRQSASAGRIDLLVGRESGDRRTKRWCFSKRRPAATRRWRQLCGSCIPTKSRRSSPCRSSRGCRNICAGFPRTARARLGKI